MTTTMETIVFLTQYKDISKRNEPTPRIIATSLINAETNCPEDLEIIGIFIEEQD